LRDVELDAHPTWFAQGEYDDAEQRAERDECSQG
jgi:hypothetical protein